MTFQVGQIVKFANPQNADEAAERFQVIEDRGERIEVEFICIMRVRPTHVYLASDLVAVEGE